MPYLVIRNDQTGATGQEKILVADGVKPIDLLMEHYPDGVDFESTTVIINKKHVNADCESELTTPLFNLDTMLVINEARELTTIYAVVAAIVAAIVVVATMPDVKAPPIPTASTRKDSPNNSHQGQSNIARPYQALPMVFGNPRIYPDLISEPISEYTQNVKFVRQYMSAHMGLGTDNEVSLGDTPFSFFQGASYSKYDPVNGTVTLPTYIEGFSVNAVDGQTLIGPNEVNITPGADNYVFDGGTMTENPSAQTATIANTNKTTKLDELKAEFDTGGGAPINVTVTYTVDWSISGEFNFLFTDATCRIVSFVDNGSTYTLGFDTFVPMDSYPPASIMTAASMYKQGAGGETVGPLFTSRSVEQLWFNFAFRRGLKGKVDVEIKFIEVNAQGAEIGTLETIVYSFSDNVLDERYYTNKLALPSAGYYKYSINRKNNALADTSTPDTCVLEEVYEINTYTNKVFNKNLTLYETYIPATINPSNQRQSQFNLRPKCEIITYSGGTINYTPSYSNYFADCLLHLYVSYYGKDPATLDLVGLYQIQDALIAKNPELAQFDFTFDDIDTSLDERMDVILQVARVTKWLDGDTYRFIYDGARQPSGLITRKDIVSESQREHSISYNPQLQSQFDSLQLEYIDPITNKKAYIYRSVDATGTILTTPGGNPKAIKLNGCQRLSQANNRADLEIRKLLYQRETLTDTLLPNGALYDRGDVVYYEEQYNQADLIGGEVLAINGSTVTTSESFLFGAGKTYGVLFTDENGDVSGPFAIAEVANEPFKFTCNDLTGVYVRDSILGYEVQRGSRYLICELSEVDRSLWVVAEKTGKGRNVQLNLVNYDSRMYEAD